MGRAHDQPRIMGQQHGQAVATMMLQTTPASSLTQAKAAPLDSAIACIQRQHAHTMHLLQERRTGTRRGACSAH
jgi:hypothetical protein